MSNLEPVPTTIIQNAGPLFTAAQRLVRAIDAIAEFNTPVGEEALTSGAEALKAARQRSTALYAEHESAESALRLLLRNIERRSAS